MPTESLAEFELLVKVEPGGVAAVRAISVVPTRRALRIQPTQALIYDG